ncbi:hypothetical protein G6L28_11875 [Agrobacterium larrymoorei]|uniref:hypothetical protein n=1 Tax=Agrobacterium larrymoorei TaxID=160699 RepID=UPI001574C837|nr:hypothetical protein [Agrobacterium larrymoorei]NTJ43293.1 hypothetical protein [Agrobacterium larrymoorei]
MFSVGRIILGAALSMLVAGSIDARADEFRDKRGGDRHHPDTHHSIAGGKGLPSYDRGIGTYAGGISAVRFKRNGIYFALDRGSINTGSIKRAGEIRSRVITVNRETMGAECSYEAGVCVIRP